MAPLMTVLYHIPYPEVSTYFSKGRRHKGSIITSICIFLSSRPPTFSLEKLVDRCILYMLLDHYSPINCMSLWCFYEPNVQIFFLFGHRYTLKKNHKSNGQKTNFWAEPRLSKASRALWVESIYPQLSIESENVQFRAQTKKIWLSKAKKGDFPRHCM